MAKKKPASDSSDQTAKGPGQELKAWIFDIQRYSINDGPGIRTTVFFKGCPLECLWCDNPESQSRLPQLFYFESLCTRCHRCVSACPNEAISVGPEDSVLTDREKCNTCGTCTVICPNEARMITGKLMSLDEVLDIVRQDTLFYRNSGGGVTASGGEASTQPAFLIEFFRRCREIGIHTTLDTTGHVQWKILKGILKNTDLVLFDIKHIDPGIHRELTGVDNSLILENARRITEGGWEIWMRFPLIPGCNDSERNIRDTGRFTLGLGLERIDILPYHRLGTGKYKRLGREYPLTDARPYSEERLNEIRNTLESMGLEVRIA